MISGIRGMARRKSISAKMSQHFTVADHFHNILEATLEKTAGVLQNKKKHYICIEKQTAEVDEVIR